MIRLLLALAIQLLANALGLLAAAWLLDGVEVTVTGFVVAVDRGRYTVMLGGRRVVAMRARELGRGRVVVGDQVAVVEYPNRGALLAMATSDAYAEIAAHRTAGLAGQLNIETTGLFVPA